MNLWLLLIIVTSTLGFADSVSGPNPRDLVRRSVDAIKADWAQAPNYSFVEHDVESKRGSAPSTKNFEVLMIEGSPYHRLLSPASQAEEERKLRSEIEKRQHESKKERDRRIAKYMKERSQDQAMLKNMADAFDFKMNGAENVNGHDCWVLDATPKPGYQGKDRETKVLAGMRGKLWIDKSANQWVKVTAEVVKPVSFYGFLAKVGPGTRFLLEQEPVADNLWLPKHFSVKVNASALGIINQNSTDDETYDHYKPIGRTTARQAPLTEARGSEPRR